MKIRIKVENKTLTATFHDNATSNDFRSLLPLAAQSLDGRNRVATHPHKMAGVEVNADGRADRFAQTEEALIVVDELPSTIAERSRFGYFQSFSSISFRSCCVLAFWFCA